MKNIKNKDYIKGQRDMFFRLHKIYKARGNPLDVLKMLNIIGEELIALTKTLK